MQCTKKEKIVSYIIEIFSSERTILISDFKELGSRRKKVKLEVKKKFYKVKREINIL